MAELEIIDAEIVPQHAASNIIDPNSNQVKSEAPAALTSLYPIYTQAERDAALQLLVPSNHDVVLGAGWVDSEAPGSNSTSSSSSVDGSLEAETQRRDSASSTSSSASVTSPSTPTFEPTTTAGAIEGITLTDALLVRSCSQGWSLSFELTSSHPLPSLSGLAPDSILIRNDAVGLNPVDWKSVSYNFGILPSLDPRPRYCGNNRSTSYEQQEGWKVGDRVWTCADSREINAGGYQRFSVHNKVTLAKVPEGLKDEEAATLGTGLVTAAVALFAFFKLPFAPLDSGLSGGVRKLNLEKQRKMSEIGSCTFYPSLAVSFDRRRECLTDTDFSPGTLISAIAEPTAEAQSPESTPRNSPRSPISASSPSLLPRTSITSPRSASTFASTVINLPPTSSPPSLPLSLLMEGSSSTL